MKLSNRLWKAIAWLVSRPWVATALIRFSQLRPFSEIRNQAGVLYMSRWWVFNPYPTSSQNRRRWNLPISIRVHHIVRPDDDRAMHDHPWNARTIILRGWYVEKRPSDLEKAGLSDQTIGVINEAIEAGKYEVAEYFTRRPGDTATLRVGEYHTITDVSEGGVYTLFISGKWRADWGFLVNGVKVWWRTYLYGTPDPKEVAKEIADNLGKPYADMALSLQNPVTIYRDILQGDGVELTPEQEANLAAWEKYMDEPVGEIHSGLPAGELPVILRHDEKVFHSGGLVSSSDFRPGEVPAILQRGEHRLTMETMKGVPLEPSGETVTVMVVNTGNTSDITALRAALERYQGRRGER